MPLPPAPEWLTMRNGTLAAGLGDTTVLVVFATSPQYRLDSRPAAGGKFTCDVTQAVNGKRIDNGSIYSTPAEAITGGLEQLRTTLGW